MFGAVRPHSSPMQHPRGDGHPRSLPRAERRVRPRRVRQHTWLEITTGDRGSRESAGARSTPALFRFSYCRWFNREAVFDELLSVSRGVIDTTMYSRSLLSRPSTRMIILSFSRRN